MNTRVPPRRYETVRQDWRSILPEPKPALFFHQYDLLENCYVMFSVSLNESIEFRKSGDQDKVAQNNDVLAELCGRFTLRISSVLHAMRQHARHFGVIPNIDQLDAANFYGARSQRAVRNSNLLAHVLLSERAQFLNKLSTLEDIVDGLGNDFIAAVRELDCCAPAEAALLWQSLDRTHYDLTTCLRETDVLLKSFLCVLPEEQLAGFDFTIAGLARARRPVTPSTPVKRIRARRIAAVAGE